MGCTSLPFVNEINNKIIKEISDKRGAMDDNATLAYISKAKDSTCKIYSEEKYGSGFFCKIPYTNNENNLINVLLTCEHVLNENIVFSDKDIKINIDDKEKIIPLKKRKIWSNKDIDYSCIEILEEDNLDNNYYQLDDITSAKKFSHDLYLKDPNSNIIIFCIMKDEKRGQYRGHCDGLIKSIIGNNYFIHNCNAYHGSSGGVIVNKNNNLVVGIHIGEYKSKNPDEVSNLGTFIKYIIEDIKIKNNNIMKVNEVEKTNEENIKEIIPIKTDEVKNVLSSNDIKKDNTENDKKIYFEDLDKESIDECKEVFDLFDKDKDGAIETKELGHVLNALGVNPTQSELLEMINEVDVDGLGKIKFQAFLELYKRKKNASDSEEDLIEAFKVLDKDGNGIIEASELRHLLTNLGNALSEEEADEMVREVDIDGDGLINYHELVKILITK